MKKRFITHCDECGELFTTTKHDFDEVCDKCKKDKKVVKK